MLFSKDFSFCMMCEYYLVIKSGWQEKGWNINARPGKADEKLEQFGGQQESLHMLVAY